jgi:hypothetical protein
LITLVGVASGGLFASRATLGDQMKKTVDLWAKRRFRTSRAVWYAASLILLVYTMLFVPGDKGGRLAGPWVDLVRGNWNGSAEACMVYLVSFLLCAITAIILGWVIQCLIVILVSLLLGHRKIHDSGTNNQCSNNSCN